MTDYSGFYRGVYIVGQGLGWRMTKVFNAAMGNTRLQERGIGRGQSGGGLAFMGSMLSAALTAPLVGVSTGSVGYGFAAAALASTIVPQLQSLYVAGKHYAEQKQKSDVPNSRIP